MLVTFHLNQEQNNMTTPRVGLFLCTTAQTISVTSKNLAEMKLNQHIKVEKLKVVHILRCVNGFGLEAWVHFLASQADFRFFGD